jgi:hypothetical protein
LSRPTLPEPRNESLKFVQQHLKMLDCFSNIRGEKQPRYNVKRIMERIFRMRVDDILLWQLGITLQYSTIDCNVLGIILECFRTIWQPVKYVDEVVDTIRELQIQSIIKQHKAVLPWIVFVLNSISTNSSSNLEYSSYLSLDILRTWIQQASDRERYSTRHDRRQRSSGRNNAFDNEITSDAENYVTKLRHGIVLSPLVYQPPCVFRDLLRRNSMRDSTIRSAVLRLIKALSFRSNPNLQEILYERLGDAILCGNIHSTGEKVPSKDSNDENTSLIANEFSGEGSDRHSSLKGQQLTEIGQLVPNSIAVASEHSNDCFTLDDQESIAAVLWNWSCSSDDLARLLSENIGLWSTLRRCCDANTFYRTHRSSSTGGECATELKFSTFRNALSTLGSILSVWTGTVTTEDENGTRVSAIELILQQTWIAPTLLCVLQTVQDRDFRRRVLRTIRRLVSTAWGLELLRISSRQKSLPPAVDDTSTWMQATMACLQSDNDKRNDHTNDQYSDDALMQACHVIDKLIVVTPHVNWMAFGPYIETMLVQRLTAISNTSGTQNDAVFCTMASTLNNYLKNSPWSSGTDAYVGCFQIAIHDLLIRHLDDPLYHAVISELALTLICDDKQYNLPVEPSAIKHEQIELLSPFVNNVMLSVLTALLGGMGPEYETSRFNALTCVEAFVKDPRNAITLALHEEILVALVNHCLMSSDSTKTRAKQILIDLVPLI